MGQKSEPVAPTGKSRKGVQLSKNKYGISINRMQIFPKSISPYQRMERQGYGTLHQSGYALKRHCGNGISQTLGKASILDKLTFAASVPTTSLS